MGSHMGSSGRRQHGAYEDLPSVGWNGHDYEDDEDDEEAFDVGSIDEQERRPLTPPVTPRTSPKSGGGGGGSGNSARNGKRGRPSQRTKRPPARPTGDGIYRSESPSYYDLRGRKNDSGNGFCFCFFASGILLLMAIILAALLLVYQHEKADAPQAGAMPSPSLVPGSSTPTGSRPFSGSTDSCEQSATRTSHTIHYNPARAGTSSSLDAFDHTALPPPPAVPKSDPTQISKDNAAYLMQPNLYNGSLVFVSEGDVFYTQLASGDNANRQAYTAMKITTTAGNVRTPTVQGPWIAYTATYTGHRDAYVWNFYTRQVTRLTYGNDSPWGVMSVAGWKETDENTPGASTSLIVCSYPNVVGMEDLRLYEVELSLDQTEASPRVSQVKPVPLSQATEDSTFHKGCWYFTRFRQSSKTVRYVGGTAESLWRYCEGDALATALTRDHVGTSKSANVVMYKNNEYLLFLSDRRRSKDKEPGDWVASSMNLWAIPLRSLSASGGDEDSITMDKDELVALTSVSCQFEGKALQEYTVDPIHGDIVLRIGADLYHLSSSEIEGLLSSSSSPMKPKKLDIAVMSDFHEMQERMIPTKVPGHLTGVDVFSTIFEGTLNVLMTLRGQTWVLPVPEKERTVSYQGAGQNLPPRRYRIAPGSLTGGSMRILNALNVPLLPSDEDEDTRRYAVLLATDPKSATGEHAFYLVEIQSDATPSFGDLEQLPAPFLGGHVNGGSVKAGGLGSVVYQSMTISPCGRRLAWADTDGRICVMTLPIYTEDNVTPTFTVLPKENELGQPMDGSISLLYWSPGGRYLVVQHYAKNQFSILSIVDCGDPGRDLFSDSSEDHIPYSPNEIKIGRIVQATPDRFNSHSPIWGKMPVDLYLSKNFAQLASSFGADEPDDVSTTLFFLTDRDIISDVTSPWGTRAPSPHFRGSKMVYALPLEPVRHEGDVSLFGRFAGGGAIEVFTEDLLYFSNEVKRLSNENKADNDVTRQLEQLSDTLRKTLRTRRLRASESAFVSRLLSDAPQDAQSSETKTTLDFPIDMDIDFGPANLSFARRAYRVTNIPKAKYVDLVCQTQDDGSLVAVGYSDSETTIELKIFSVGDFPEDNIQEIPAPQPPGFWVSSWGTSTDRKHIYVVYSPAGVTRVIKNTVKSLGSFLSDMKGDAEEFFVEMDDMALSVMPNLEYRHLFNDAWRMLRDYFYDREMHGLDWDSIHTRYLPLVHRCRKREELDDALAQLAAELSALHVFVYGGEYSSPFEGQSMLTQLHEPASLGVSLERAPEWNGYRVTEIPERDPDFSIMDNKAVYCPVSEQTLSVTGQKGLQVGDIIVGINGESVMLAPDIFFLLRGTAGRSVRLEVLRLASGSDMNDPKEASTEAIVVSPIGPREASHLRYNAWEWRTRQKARELASEAGFTVGYVHLQSMGSEDEDQFARDYFPDYDKDALILDVRHNSGGNIDSWVISILQRKAWMFWQGRTGVRTGDSDWDEQFAFRGHIVVLIDEKTSSDGEGVSRGIAELGLGRLIGTRTWGGGIWLSSDNRLVDGGIASAPEMGTFNDKFGYGMGIENHGVIPDIVVDNNPRTAFDGKDTQLERAILELKQWLQDEPVVIPNPPKHHKDVSIVEDCPAQ